MIKPLNGSSSSYSAASLLSSLCIALLIAIFLLSDYFSANAPTRFSGSKLKYYSVPLVQLQTKVLMSSDGNDDRLPATTGSSSTAGFSPNRFRNQSVRTRKVSAPHSLSHSQSVSKLVSIKLLLCVSARVFFFLIDNFRSSLDFFLFNFAFLNLCVCVFF